MKLTCSNHDDKRFSKLLRPHVGAFIALGAGILMTIQGQAAVKTWDGSSNGNWSTAANWTGGVAPVDGDDLVFPSGAANLINTNNLSGLDLRTVTFTGNGYTINGNSITITNGISGQQASGANTINLVITLDASQTFDCINAGASQQFNGAVALGTTYSLTISGNGDLGFAGVISGSGGNVTKNGNGTVTFSGTDNNTYTGTTYVYAGILQLNKWRFTIPVTTRIAIPGNLVVGSGSIGPDIVRLLVNNQIADTSIVSVNGAGILDLNGNSDTIGTSLVMNGNAEIWSGAGVLSLGSNCTVTGNPTGASRITGNLNLGASGTCTFDILDDWFYLDAIVSGAANIVKTGAGRLFFNAANTFTGLLTADDGTVGVADNLALGANGSPTSGTVISNTATLQIWTAVNVGEEYLTLNTAAPTVALFNSSETNSWAGPIKLIGTQVIDVWPGTLELSGAISGSGGITKIGAGTLRLSTAWDNYYSGSTVVNEGTLELSKPSIFWATGSGTLIIGDGVGGSGVDVVRYTSTGSDQLPSSVAVIINSSGLLDLNGHSDYMGKNLTLNAGQITTGAGLFGLASNASITLSGSSSISGNFNLGSGTCSIGGVGLLYIFANVSGSANIVKNDSVSLQLYGNNTFTGTMTANTSGYLLLGSDRSLGDPAAGTTLNGNTHLYIYTDLNITNESLTLNSSYNPTIYVYGYTNIWNTTNFTLSADATIQVVSNGVLQIIAPITGSGGLNKDGPGRLVFSGSGGNTYTGNTVVEEGVLELNKSGGWAIGYGALTIGDGWGGFKTDIVRYTGGSSSEINTAVPITVRSTGWLDLNGHTDDLGPIELDNGQITTGAGSLVMYGDLTAYDAGGTNSDPSISGKITLGGTCTFSVSNTAGLYVSAVVSGSAGIVKTGPGFMYLQSANAYTGLTEVRQGYLWASDELALGTTASGTVVSNGASLVMSGGIGVTNESLTLNGPGVSSSWGAFDVESSGTNFWTGPIILNADSTIAPYSGTTHLRLSGAIGGSGGLTKGPGSGTLYLDGSIANTYGGTTRVNSGTLVLNKPAGVVAVPGPLEINGLVQLAANYQTAESSDVTINSLGRLETGGHNDYIDALSGSGGLDLGGDGWLVIGRNHGTSTFDGVISGGGDLYKFGDGTITLTGFNNYTGWTYITTGTLLVNGYQPASPVGYYSSTIGSLGGRGVVGPIAVAGHLRPGTSPGCLTSSNLTFASTGNYHVELNGYSPCSGYDQMVVRGTNNLANATLSVTGALPGTPAVGQQFIIINNDGSDPITGTFNGLADGATFDVGGIGFQIDYQGGDGNDVVLTVVNAPGASVTLNATDRGWYDSTGHHDAGNNNYVAGDGDATTNAWRNWFVFDVPAFTGTIVEAELLINCYTNVSDYGGETYVLRHVSTPIATLRAGGSGLVAIYNDLADGAVYAVRDVSVLESGERAIIPLNVSFINQATAAKGNQIALGGALATLDTTTNNQRLFGYSFGPADAVQLRLTFGTATLVDAVTSGWYNDAGYHNGANRNYLAGRELSQFRNFFLFNLPLLSALPSDAQLLVNSYTNISSAGVMNYQLHDVMTTIVTLTNDATGATSVFADLADGVVYGGRDVFVTEAGTKLSLPLGQPFRAAAYANSGGQIALGGAVTLSPGSTTEFLFGNSSGIPGDAQLWLGFVPSTLPTPVFLPGAPVYLGNNTFQLVLASTTGTTNEIQASMDFVNWDAVRTLYMTNPTNTFNHTNTVFPYRFFRARLLQ